MNLFVFVVQRRGRYNSVLEKHKFVVPENITFPEFFELVRKKFPYTRQMKEFDYENSWEYKNSPRFRCENSKKLCNNAVFEVKKPYPVGMLD